MSRVILSTMSGEQVVNAPHDSATMKRDIAKLIKLVEQYGNSCRIISAESCEYRKFKVIRSKYQ